LSFFQFTASDCKRVIRWVLFGTFCTGLAAASDKAYQLLAHGRWLSPGIPASSTIKTGRHYIAEIFAESGIKHKNQSINQSTLLVQFTD
jgi:fructose-specific phosphotransferase system IIC component